MKVTPQAFPDILLIEPRVFQDERGFFLESFQAPRYEALGLPRLVQDNHSGSRRGVLRGLHYQITRPQGKLVSVVVGEIFDVAVDLRRTSATFGKWTGLRLQADRQQQLWIPPGYAHGFLVLSEWAEVIYKASDFYHPPGERTLLWNDPTVNVAWPLPPDTSPKLAPKDTLGSFFEQLEYYS